MHDGTVSSSILGTNLEALPPRKGFLADQDAPSTMGQATTTYKRNQERKQTKHEEPCSLVEGRTNYVPELSILNLCGAEGLTQVEIAGTSMLLMCACSVRTTGEVHMEELLDDAGYSKRMPISEASPVNT